MKATIGFGFFLLFLAGIALVTLKGRQMAGQGMTSGGAELTGTNWRPVSVGDMALSEDSGMYVSFDVDGSIKGHGGCNKFFGSLQKSDAESGIEVGPLGATRMACDEPVMSRETGFLEAVQNTKGFATNSDGLRLMDSDGNTLAELVESTGG